jgi:hypothetical protein
MFKRFDEIDAVQAGDEVVLDRKSRICLLSGEKIGGKRCCRRCGPPWGWQSRQATVESRKRGGMGICRLRLSR